MGTADTLEILLKKINDTLDSINKNVTSVNEKIDVWIDKLEVASNKLNNSYTNIKVEKWIESLREK